MDIAAVIAIAIAISGPALASKLEAPAGVHPEAQQLELESDPCSGCAAIGLACSGCAAIGLVCCGDGWCMAVFTNSDCGPENDLYSCAWGESTTTTSGAPDVICYD